jgi:DNA-directed RNA polymerase specialized sigma24 family protein
VRKYTAEEDEYIRENYGKLDAGTIGGKIGRSAGTVSNRRRRLGIPVDPHTRFLRAADIEPVPELSTDLGLHDLGLDTETRLDLETAIAELPELLRQTICLCFLAYREESIATAMGISRSAVSKRKLKAIGLLKDRLGGGRK